MPYAATAGSVTHAGMKVRGLRMGSGHCICVRSSGFHRMRTLGWMMGRW